MLLQKEVWDITLQNKNKNKYRHPRMRMPFFSLAEDRSSLNNGEYSYDKN